MTIFNIYIYTKRGTCLYYHEWHRPQSTLREMPEEDQKLMFGLLFSLKQLMNKAAPVPEQPQQLPAFGPDQGFFRFATDSYVLYHLEAPTGYKFVLTADAAAGDLRPALWTIYSEIFTAYAMKNAMYIPGTKIENVGFTLAIDGFVKGLPGFQAA